MENLSLQLKLPPVQRKKPIGNPSTKPTGKLIRENQDWFNASLHCGKQGYLRDRFYEILMRTDDFLSAKAEIEKESKWQAEIKGLSVDERLAFLLGFFSSLNEDIPEEFQIILLDN